ncbi:YqcI/YcgG family protein, partial [Methylobacterium sp. CCH5-D2]
RRFEAPVLVFNLHDQFERLRAEGRYERLRETILARDVDLAGSVNPMLARHGERSEAVQYSGRAVPADWACPFRRGAPEPADWAAVARDLGAGAFDARRLAEAAGPDAEGEGQKP